MIAIELLVVGCLMGDPLTLACQEPQAPANERALRFLEREIATTRELLAGDERTYQVSERSASPGLTLDAITRINQYLTTLGCDEEAVRSLQHRLDIRVRPPTCSATTIHVAMSPGGGSAILVKERNGLAMWAEWSVPERYRMDYFPAGADTDGGVLEARIQVNSFDEGEEYDPLAVRVARLRELLDWGLATASSGNCTYSSDAEMETLRVLWSRAESGPPPVRLGLQLAFTIIGQEVEFNMQRAISPSGERTVSHLQVVQRDRSGQMLRCEEFQWHGVWPASFATSKMEYFPGGRLLFKSEHIAIMDEPEPHFGAVLSTMPSRSGASVLDWRIDGELGEYRFQGDLPSLSDLQTLVNRSKR